jgi:hypothetical protein
MPSVSELFRPAQGSQNCAHLASACSGDRGDGRQQGDSRGNLQGGGRAGPPPAVVERGGRPLRSGCRRARHARALVHRCSCGMRVVCIWGLGATLESLIGLLDSMLTCPMLQYRGVHGSCYLVSQACDAVVLQVWSLTSCRGQTSQRRWPTWRCLHGSSRRTSSAWWSSSRRRWAACHVSWSACVCKLLTTSDASEPL